MQEYRGQIPSPGRPSVAWREDRVRFWAAIASGAKTRDAGVAAGVSAPVAQRWFLHAGGVNPKLDPMLSGRYLSSSNREEIALWRAQGCGVREIARQLGRSPSTISRELRRNASTRTYRLDYKASTAQWHSERRARRPKSAKLITNERLRDYVNDKLSGHISMVGGERLGPKGPVWDGKNKPHREDREWVTAWSPQQIAKRLPLTFADDPSMRISHEAIYQAPYIPARGGLTREQSWHLRRGRTKRMPRARTRAQVWAHVTEATTLTKRPSEADDRDVAGHWEGDLILGSNCRSAIATLVERKTRFTMLVHLPGDHSAIPVRDGLLATIKTLPERLAKTLTWDQGTELAQHRQITMATKMAIYFCDPHSPWQRGTNENTNGLRQYFPKGTDLSVHSPQQLLEVVTELNNRPRKTLGGITPAQAMQRLLSDPEKPIVATTT